MYVFDYLFALMLIQKSNSYLIVFLIPFPLQIGPNGTCVFGLTTRSTIALQAYNRVVGNIIPKYKYKNFFKLIQFLQNEEFTKSREFETLLNHNGANNLMEITKCKNFCIAMECIEKTAKIEKTIGDLLRGTISATTFLNQMVMTETQICTNMEPDVEDGQHVCYVKKETEPKIKTELSAEQKTKAKIDAEQKVKTELSAKQKTKTEIDAEQKTKTEVDAKQKVKTEIDVEELEMEDSSEECLDLESKPLIVCLVDEPNLLKLTCKHIEICKECILKVQENYRMKKRRKLNCQACLQPLDDTV